MLVYFIMIILVAFFSVLADKKPRMLTYATSDNLTSNEKPYRSNFMIWIVFLCLAFVSAFRYDVGTDFFSYFNNVKWADAFNKGDFVEPGFTLLAIICNNLFDPEGKSLTIVCSIITTALFVLTIAKRSENFSISILLFVFAGCFTGAFNGVRQYLATAIMFAGYHFVVDKKPFKWLLVVLLASTFHITSLLMFFVYFVCNLDCDIKLIILYIGIAVVLLFSYEPLFKLVGLLKQEDIDSELSYMKTSVNILRVLVQCVPIIFLFFADKNKVNGDNETRFLLNICLLNAAIAVAAMNSAYFSRFWIYTSCFQILMYPSLFKKMNTKDRFVFIVLLLLLYSLYWTYDTINNPALNNFKWLFNYLK